MATPLNAETLMFFTRCDDESPPGLAGHRHSGCLQASHVLPNLQTAGGRRPGLLSILPFPQDRSEHWRVLLAGEECVIPVSGALRRASAWEDPTEHNVAEVLLRDTVDRLSGYFMEAIFLTHDSRFPAFHEFADQAVARLAWQDIWDRWKNVSTGDEPRMARIVEVAFSHLAGIRDVCDRPRRMLVRQRETLPVGRVQELDGACLRDLIQRPGHTVLEKAGTRQEIMAITRRETVDTAENRVVRDLIRLCQHRARAYERENGRAMQRQHPKVKAVVRLRQSCERLDVASPISTVGRLAGVPRANYVLQRDRRYHPLWVQYDKLRNEEAEVDSVWAWSRRLWAEFVRGVITSFLCSSEARSTCGWQLDEEVVAYLRAEHQAGCFVPALSVSSRWARHDRQARMFVVHPVHAHLCPGLEEVLPRLGADLALVVYPPSSGPLRPRALLCIYTVLSLRTCANERNAMTASLRSTLDLVVEQNPGLNVRALLLRGGCSGDQVPETPLFSRLDYLVADAGGPFWFDEFSKHLTVLLEELAG